MDRNRKALDKYIENFRPRLICFTAVSTEYAFIQKTALYIKKKHPDIFLLIGGPHVSLNPEDAIEGPFDAVCIGEGEYPALELVSQLEKGSSPANINNLWIKQGDEIYKNPVRPFIKEIDDLPFPDRDIWRDWTEDSPDSEIPVLLGRGCPFQCTYCCNHALRKLATGQYVRFRSVDNIMKEIKDISVKYPDKTNIYLEVETIGANRQWLEELCSSLTDFNNSLKKPLSYRTNLRITPGMPLEQIFTALKKGNFTAVSIGLESGSERVRRDILNRNYSNKDILEAVKSARRHGLKVYFYNLIGVPGESEADFADTIKMNRLCQPDKTYVHIFYPYPGTELYFKAKTGGLLSDNITTELERCTAVLDLPEFSKKRIQNGFIWFDYKVYKGYRPLSRILPKVIVSMLRSNSSLHYLYRNFTYSRLIRKIKKSLSPS